MTSNDVYPLSGYAVLPGVTLRINEVDPNKPMFVARDVAVALGYKTPQKAVMDHCPHRTTVPKQNGGSLTLIPESDVYSLIFSSKLPAAEEFQRRVFEEILPTIRKHGMYATPDTLDRMLADPDFGIKMLETVKAEREKVAALEGEIIEQAPKVDYAEATTDNMTRFQLRQTAKLLGVPLKAKLQPWLVNGNFLKWNETARRFLPTDDAREKGYVVPAVYSGVTQAYAYEITESGLDQIRYIVTMNEETF
jgi:prophage antirepressor-like protein